MKGCVKTFIFFDFFKIFFREKHLRRTITRDKSVPNFDYHLLHQVSGNTCSDCSYIIANMFVCSATALGTYKRKFTSGGHWITEVLTCLPNFIIVQTSVVLLWHLLNILSNILSLLQQVSSLFSLLCPVQQNLELKNSEASWSSCFGKRDVFQ